MRASSAYVCVPSVRLCAGTQQAGPPLTLSLQRKEEGDSGKEPDKVHHEAEVAVECRV